MNKFLRFGLIFSTSYLILILLFPAPEKVIENKITVDIQKEFEIWDLVNISINNTTSWAIVFKDNCPNSIFKVEKIDSWEKIEITKNIETKNCSTLNVAKWELKNIDFWENNIKLFWKEWEYKITAETLNWKIFEKTFEITSQWFFSQLWNTFFYKPIYNALIALIQYWPQHNLAFWIIILTIVIKLFLLIPNHKALKNQKDMQKVQPELAKIKEKYKWDQQKLAQETMKVWKKYKVNPLWSCLPLIIQFPILIAIFFTIKEWLTPNNSYLLYSRLEDFDFQLIQTTVFWIFDLKNSWNFILAWMVWGLQFFQMSLTFKWQKQDANPSDMMAIQMQMMSKMMKYVMPAMITVFTFTMPSWVWLYWLVSTAFAVFQQFVINKMYDKDDSSKANKKWKSKKIEAEDAVIVSKWKKWKTKKIEKVEIVSKKRKNEKKKNWITTIKA